MCASMCESAVRFQEYKELRAVLAQVFDSLYVESAAICAADALSYVCEKRQTKMLSKYLEGAKASAFVVERQYVDRDFMEDFASYYARCFQPFGRFCCRVHFWGPGVDVDSMTAQLYTAVLEGGIDERSRKIGELYLGYVVFRPLPHTVYGRICLRPYAPGHDICFCVQQKIDVHLLGIPLHVKTMPFQEQDTVISACATSALWSAFQITGRKFIHAIPSPHRITNMATLGGDCETRPFPNKGLTIGQMGRAIFMVGLSLQTLSSRMRSIFVAEVYAYLKIGLPVVLVAEMLEDESKGDNSADWHAVTVCGYHINPKTHGRVCNGIRLLGADIDELYCHDDRIAPFAKMTICGGPDEEVNNWQTQMCAQHKTDYEIISMKYALVPVYHKIRIGLVDVISELHGFNDLLKVALMDGADGCAAVGDELVWDIHLSTDVDVKQEVRTVSKYDSQGIVRILDCAMPRYIWKASVSLGEDRLAIFLIDATGIAQGLNVFLVMTEDHAFGELLAKIAKNHVDSNNSFVKGVRPKNDFE